MIKKAAYDTAYNSLYLLIVLMGVGGTILGYVVINRAKDEYVRSKKEFDDNMRDIRISKRELKASVNQASIIESKFNERLAEVTSYEEDVRAMAKDAIERFERIDEDGRKILENLMPNDKESELERETVDKVANDNNAPTLDRIRALALKFHDDSDWKKALSLWQTLETLLPTDSQVLFHIGFTYAELATNPAYIPISCLEKACKYYETVTILTKKNHAAFNNWGNAISEIGRLKDNEESYQLFAESIEKYIEAVRLDPDYAQAFSNWGNALTEMAKLKEGAKANQLFSEAIEKLAESARLDPNFIQALSNWGYTLSVMGRSNKGEKGYLLLTEAKEKYAESNRLDPNNPISLRGWGVTLMEMATRKEGAEADLLFAKAEEKFLRASEIIPESEHFNLSCLYSLAGDIDKCRKHLEKSILSEHFPGVQYMETESDFDTVREEQWFKDLLNLAREREAYNKVQGYKENQA